MKSFTAFSFVFLVALLFSTSTAQAPPQQEQARPRWTFPLISALQGIQCNRIIPSSVVGLQATPETNTNGKMTLTWTKPANNPCFVKYEVAIFEKTSGLTGAALQVLTLDTSSTVIEGLQPGKEYIFSVKALVPTLGASEPQTVTAGFAPSVTASNGPANTMMVMGGQPQKSAARLPIFNWTCEPSPTIIGLPSKDGTPTASMSYPWCKAAQSGMCTASSCESLAAQGLCSSPLLKKTDWVSRKITQHCAEVCPCDATPSLRDSLIPVGDDVCCDIVAGQYWLDPSDGKPTNGLQFL